MYFTLLHLVFLKNSGGGKILIAHVLVESNLCTAHIFPDIRQPPHESAFFEQGNKCILYFSFIVSVFRFSTPVEMGHIKQMQGACFGQT